MKQTIAITLLFAAVAWAQEPNVNPALEAILKARELQQAELQLRKEEERKKNLPTIKQNMADYESEDPEIRRRAILILGKYRNDPLALMVLKKALKDPEGSVRQGALVVLSSPPVDRITANSMMLLLTDPEVSIRRICSATLPTLMQLYVGPITVVEGKVVRPPPAVGEHLKKRILAAHSDEDETVRKNMVDVWPYMRGLVTEPVFRKMLKDSSRDVRISALDHGSRVIGNEAYYKAIKGMVRDKDQLVRLRLANVFSFTVLGDAIEPLRTLSKDPDFDVSTAALVGLVSKGRPEAWEALKDRFSDGRLKTETATQAIGYLLRLGDTGRDELIELVTHNRTAFRAAAAKALVRTGSVTVPPETILKLIEDSNSDVRQAGSQFLLRNRQLAITHIDTVTASPFPDIREMGVTLSIYLKPDKREDLLMDLFLDDNVNVRSAALRRIVSMRVKGWQELASDAMDDDQEDVQQAAVNALLSIRPRSGTPQGSDVGGQILNNYLNTGADEALKTYIRVETARRTPVFRRPPTPPRPAPVLPTPR